MATTVDYRFVVKRDTAANFTTANTLLLQGEFGLELDTLLVKMGDGSTAWNSLGYFYASPAVMSKILDLAFSNTQGSILYRDSAVWKALAPGTAGYVLQTNGAAADPTWDPQTGGGGGSGIQDLILSAIANATCSLGASTPGNVFDFVVTSGTLVALGYGRYQTSATYNTATNATYTVPGGKSAYLAGTIFDLETQNNWSFYKHRLYNSTTSAGVAGPTTTPSAWGGSVQPPFTPIAQALSQIIALSANAAISLPYILATAGQVLVCQAASAGDGNYRPMSGIYIFDVH